MLPIGDDSLPGRGFAWVTATLIGLNVAVFVALQGATGDNPFTYGFSAIPRELLHGVDLVSPEQVLIGGQSYFVPQEPRAGRILFIAAYLGAGVVGTLAQVWSEPDSPIPTLGASGAISGVLGAYLVLFPRNRVTAVIFNFVTRVPAVVAIGMWIVLQLVNGLGAAAISSETAGGVAYLAHFGGFAVGLLAGLIFRSALPEPEPRYRSR